jgi:hypothetical protein
VSKLAMVELEHDETRLCRAWLVYARILNGDTKGSHKH